jgi:hypothetical protein
VRAGPLTLGVVVAALCLAQLVPVARTNSPVVADLTAPPEVSAVLREACYDCHSGETRWPWYSRVAPTSWLVAHDVTEGREHLDFSTWGTLPPRQRTKLLGKIAQDVDEGEMPPWAYALVHPDARLGDDARRALIGWARDAARAGRP